MKKDAILGQIFSQIQMYNHESFVFQYKAWLSQFLLDAQFLLL